MLMFGRALRMYDYNNGLSTIANKSPNIRNTLSRLLNSETVLYRLSNSEF